MPPHSSPARGLLPLLSSTHNAAPCIHCICTRSSGYFGEWISVTSHFPISRPFWPHPTSTLEVRLRFGWCQIILELMHLCLCRRTPTSSSSLSRVCTLSSVPCTGSAQPSLHCYRLFIHLVIPTSSSFGPLSRNEIGLSSRVPTSSSYSSRIISASLASSSVIGMGSSGVGDGREYQDFDLSKTTSQLTRTCFIRGL